MKSVKFLSSEHLFKVRCSKCGKSFDLNGNELVIKIFGIFVECPHCHEFISSTSITKCPKCKVTSIAENCVKVEFHFVENFTIIELRCKNCSYNYFIPYEKDKHSDCKFALSSLKDAKYIVTRYFLNNQP